MARARYATVGEARRDFRNLLDVAQQGGSGQLRRDGVSFSVVATGRLRELYLAVVELTPEVFLEGEGVGIALPGAPFAAEGASLNEAAEVLVEDLREYSEDWPRLRQASNHRQLGALVGLVDNSTDEELIAWLTGLPT